jgi:hypothetical protein
MHSPIADLTIEVADGKDIPTNGLIHDQCLIENRPTVTAWIKEIFEQFQEDNPNYQGKPIIAENWECRDQSPIHPSDHTEQSVISNNDINQELRAVKRSSHTKGPQYRTNTGHHQATSPIQQEECGLLSWKVCTAHSFLNGHSRIN